MSAQGIDRERAGSFGAAAHHYHRYRPGPADEVAAWLVPGGARRVVDLGAGTGALTRLLVGRADEVVAVEPDARMRAVLEAAADDVTVLEGHSEAIPLADASADAVVVSSAWHWMEPAATSAEVARVLVDGGALGVVWSGVDWESPWFEGVRRLAGEAAAAGDAPALAPIMAEMGERPRHVLELPAAAPFDPPVHEVLRWDRTLTAQDLVGLLGTFSSVLTLPAARRAEVLAEAARLLDQVLGLRGDDTVTLDFRAECWRARRRGR